LNAWPFSRKVPVLTMAQSSATRGPAWLRHPIAKFFASVKLAVVLLSVLIIAAITGTIYESSFDAKVARAYVYGAPWFNIWLTLLGANLAVSAFSRWPWRKHHVAFLVTHLGIITLLAGSLIGRIWGIEGTTTLFKGEPPTNRLLVDQRELRVRDVDGILKAYPAEFLHRPPSPEHPRDLGVLASGARLRIIDYAPAIDAKLDPKQVTEGGAPAVHFTINTAMMNQRLESWLLADDVQHASFSMGLANIQFKRGRASSSTDQTKSTPTDIEESIFAFSKAPDEQIGRVLKGGNTGAKVKLDLPANQKGGRVTITMDGKETSFDVARDLGHELKLPDTNFTVTIDKFWPDFRIQDGQPATLSDQPNNPAVLVTLRGKGTPLQAASPSAQHGSGRQFDTNGGPPAMPLSGTETSNDLTLFIADDGAITYELTSRKNGRSSGSLDLNKPLATGWADWQLMVDKMMPRAVQWMQFTPANREPNSTAPELADGIRVRLEQNGETFEQWVPAGWQITMPTSPQETAMIYGYRQISLPIGLELLDFEVKRNEGTDSPAGFKSNLRVSNMDGDSANGSCWMNHPFSFPTEWWRPWTGFTFKISQASWNPDNLNQSTVQILRDPGWLFKWIGSLLVVAGVFMMFYLRPYRKQTVGEPIRPDSSGSPAESRDRRRTAREMVPSLD
jgi:hypothetical protein